MPLIRFVCCDITWDENKWFTNVGFCGRCHSVVYGEKAPKLEGWEEQWYKSNGVDLDNSHTSEGAMAHNDNYWEGPWDDF